MHLKKLSAALAALLVAGVVYAAGGFDRLKDTVKIGQGTASDKVIEFDVGASPNAKLTGLAAGTSISSSVNFSILDQGDLRLNEGTGGGTNYVALQAPSTLAADYTLTFPADDGNANELMHTNGSGVLTWSPVVSADVTDGTLVNADINASADIARSKIASGTADHVVINSGTGALSSEAALSPARGGTGVANNSAATLNRNGSHALTITTSGTTSITLPTSGTLVGSADTGTVSSTMILNGTIVDADINASAAITGSKLAAATSGVAGAVTAVTQDFGGGKTIVGNANERQLTVRANATQTAAPFVVETSGASTLFEVASDGKLTGKSGLTSTSTFYGVVQMANMISTNRANETISSNNITVGTSFITVTNSGTINTIQLDSGLAFTQCILFIRNTSGGNVLLAHNTGSPTAARINTPSGSTITLTDGQKIIMMYDDSAGGGSGAWLPFAAPY